jgi:uncharacterized repeat protein (TIGR03847 family)
LAENFELEEVEALAAAATGEPGRRRFFLLARAGTQDLVLACEKFHIQGLVARARELLENQELGSSQAGSLRPTKNPAVGEPRWQIGELGLGYHESRRRFVIVAREAQAGAEEPSEPATAELGVARIWVTPEQVRDFTEQADAVLAGGRPTCQYCGLPIDPGGHPCPASNGSRPIF